MISTGRTLVMQRIQLLGALVFASAPMAAVAAVADLQAEVRLLGQAFASYDSTSPGETRFLDARAAGSLGAGTLQPGDVLGRSGSGSFSRTAQPPEGCEACGSIAVVGTGSGQVSARAAYGSLGVSAISALDASWTFPQGAYFAGAQLSSDASARFTDTLTLLSNGQPAGTPVRLALDSDLDLALSLTGVYSFLVSGNPSVSVRYEVDVLRAGQTFALPSFNATYSHVEFESGMALPSLRHAVDVQVGDVLTVGVSFAAQAGLQTGGGDGGSASGGRIDATGTAAAMNSLNTRIDVLSAGVVLQSASGHDYLASPVPEPPPAWLWVCALLAPGLQWCRRQMHTGRSASTRDAAVNTAQDG